MNLVQHTTGEDIHPPVTLFNVLYTREHASEAIICGLEMLSVEKSKLCSHWIGL